MSGSDRRLAGYRVVVTGGGRGLGRAIAEDAAESGAHVVIVARSADQLGRTVSDLTERGLNASAIQADVSEIDSLEGLAQRLTAEAAVHGIVHAAGVQVRKPASQITRKEFEFVQRVNTQAPYALSLAIARQQIETKNAGSHVFIGSLNSTIARPNVSPYAISKTALLGVARSISTEYAIHRIRANVLAPGYVHTSMTEDLLSDPDQRNRILERIPMGRLGEAQEIARVCTFLLSDDSSYITGSTINVDGGWLSS